MRRAFTLIRRYSTALAAKEDTASPCSLEPLEIVEQLDRFIIGQAGAKRAVAIALRNRWRRHRVPDELRDEIHPKNMLMVGPTGVGKTEIARRVAKLTSAPFVKVECTKFTEVGFVGRDVDSIIDDLYRAASNSEKQKIREQNHEAVMERAKEHVLSKLCGPAELEGFRSKLEAGELDTTKVDVEVQIKNQNPQQRMSGSTGFISMEMLRPGGRSQTKRLPVPDAIHQWAEAEMEKLLDNDEVHRRAVQACEQDGIVVIDEIDKVVVSPDSRRGNTASDEGVQQDLLPLIEGTVVNTKYGGPICTDHVLFIASGAFHSVKPSDMIAELQGRLPIRVELQPLTQDDFYRILTEPSTNLISQHGEMLKTEGVTLKVEDAAIQEMAKVAFMANASIQNIGARRLHTVVERVLEEISFNAPDMEGQEVLITPELVRTNVGDILEAQDLRKYLI
eukprot:NODE_1391_length_1523_cov_262.206304_g1316_i0.p1 GENE.NODE_1391_length_1523_cov_262.206304_g1316_i0~~NODE_1391_length_1523_cov_262.206304_g1316_i0.p1  ORF type:complete len:449 (+),score=116.42 NODE_1391_length_1523_cov_262.206304_g1316_i0:60-1406(+)